MPCKLPSIFDCKRVEKTEFLKRQRLGVQIIVEVAGVLRSRFSSIITLMRSNESLDALYCLTWSTNASPSAMNGANGRFIS